jgi:membrane-bound lytic murein transglycosylase D
MNRKTHIARPIPIKYSVFLGFIMTLLLFPLPSIAQSERFQKLGLTLDTWSEAQIGFWKRIYTEFTTNDYVLHDPVNLARIYEIVSSEKEVSRAKNDTREALLRLAKLTKMEGALNENTLSDSDRKIYSLLERSTDPEVYEFAADPMRMRVQLGQRDRLENAYSISKLYLLRMEEMLEEEGVPRTLSMLPFVESGFNQNARSHVGAIGIWQFMPKTAMRDLRVDSAIDERYDPLKSTRAAAKFLMRNEKYLGNWGLAIMAYHHGPGLVMSAVKRLHTHDPITIIRNFHNPQFLFASRNYLFEFLAMSDVDAKHEIFFKNEENLKLPEFITVSFPRKLTMKMILKHYHLDDAQARILNPHFRLPIWSGQASIPAHYPVRLSGITLEEFRKLKYP